ncbi:MAG: Signal recognition particle protein Ffh, partial [uncultured Lysobacter sp.]
RQQADEAVPADGKDDVQAFGRRHEGAHARHEGHDGRSRRHAVPL